MDRGEVAETTSEGTFGTLATLETAADLLLLCAVPAALLAASTLSPAVRQSFVFEYDNPTLHTAVLSSFVHVGSRHLAANLLGYAVVVPAAYLLSAATGERRRFRVVFVSLVIVCPVVLPYLNLAVSRASGSAGFSGVLMALYGYLPLALASHAQGRFDIGRRRTTAPLLFLIGLALIALLTLGAVLTYGVTVPYRGRTVAVGHVLTATLVGLLVVLALVILLYGLSAAEERETAWREKLRVAAKQAGQFELAVAGTALFLSLPFATFPVNPVVGGRVLNLYVHLLGYALGFIASYVLVVIESAPETM